MKDRVFFDSNIIIYSYSSTESDKSAIANELIFSLDEVIVSTQVINEVTNILYKKFKLDTSSIRNAVLEIDNNFRIVGFSLKTQLKALEIKDKYKLQYYDSLILATALENGCTVLYSEDMQHNQIIENKLKIVNPFIKS